MEITSEILADLKEKAQKATPGPWIMGQNGEVYSEDRDDFPVDIIEGICVEETDASYIAAASRDVVIAMIEKIKTQEKEVDWLANYIGEHVCINGEPGTTICPSPQACKNCWHKASRKALEK